MMSGYDYIKRTYGLDYLPGQRVRHTVTKKEGLVLRCSGSAAHYVQVRFDGEKHGSPCHPEELEIVPFDPAAAARASFEEDHSLGARSWDRGGSRDSIPTTQGAEGRNWAGE